MSETVTCRIEFEMSYLMKVGGKYSLESHRVRFEAVVDSDKASGQMIIRFEDLKRLMRNIIPDGAIVFSEDDVRNDLSMKRLVSIVREFSNSIIIIPTFDDLSAEKILQYLTMELEKLLNSQYPDVTIVETKFRENSESYVTMKLK